MSDETRCRRVAAAAVFVAAVLPGAAAAGGVAECAAAGRSTVAVHLTVPDEAALGGVKIVLDYPEGTLAIPGRGDEASVKARLGDTPAGFITLPNDRDGSLLVVLVSGTDTLSAGRIFTVALDRCEGAPAPAAGQLRCRVEEAARDCGMPLEGAGCVARIDGNDEPEGYAPPRRDAAPSAGGGGAAGDTATTEGRETP
jgi:hypothetical protein